MPSEPPGNLKVQFKKLLGQVMVVMVRGLKDASLLKWEVLRRCQFSLRALFLAASDEIAIIQLSDSGRKKVNIFKQQRLYLKLCLAPRSWTM